MEDNDLSSKSCLWIDQNLLVLARDSYPQGLPTQEPMSMSGHTKSMDTPRPWREFNSSACMKLPQCRLGIEASCDFSERRHQNHHLNKCSELVSVHSGCSHNEETTQGPCFPLVTSRWLELFHYIVSYGPTSVSVISQLYPVWTLS